MMKLMDTSNRDILNSFTVDDLPYLDTVVLGALELFASRELPQIDISGFKRPLVVGSGNADATGRIIFADTGAIFASESSFEDKLRNIPDIDEVVVVSASGAKHAPIITKAAIAAGKHVTLITTTPNSLTEQAATPEQLTTHVLPKNREPYTYNTSTYMGMILGYTHEDAGAIKKYIEDVIAPMDFSKLAGYDKFVVILPPQFSGLSSMVKVKFVELFGRNLARDVETTEGMTHAITVAPANELYLSFGEPNTTWGTAESRYNVPLPDSAGYAAAMAITYYVVAQIQRQKPQYFKDNIAAYMQFISAVFGEELDPIVPDTP